MEKIICKSFKAFVVFAILAVSLGSVQTLQAQKSVVKNIVLVHGAFADGSGWKGVYDILTKKGYNVRIAQIPLTGLNEDVAATQSIIDRIDGQVILVGHSWAGNVITEAGINPKVVALVYIAAFLPDVGESAGQLVSSMPIAPENGITPPGKDGYIFYDRAKFHAGFCADLTKAESDFMEASQVPIIASAFGSPAVNIAWKTKPSFAVVTLEDKNIPFALQRQMYKRANSTITELKSSHVAYISHAAEVAAVIVSASKSGK